MKASGVFRIVDNVFSGSGQYLFEVLTGDRVWVSNSRALGQEYVREATVEKCAHCGGAIGEVRSADFPGIFTCERCFLRHVGNLCRTTPGQVLRGLIPDPASESAALALQAQGRLGDRDEERETLLGSVSEILDGLAGLSRV